MRGPSIPSQPHDPLAARLARDADTLRSGRTTAESRAARMRVLECLSEASTSPAPRALSTRRRVPAAAALLLALTALFVYRSRPAGFEPPAAASSRRAVATLPSGAAALLGRSAGALGRAVDEPLLMEFRAIASDTTGAVEALLAGLPEPLRERAAHLALSK